MMEVQSLLAMLLTEGITAKVIADDHALPMIVLDDFQFREHRDWLEIHFCPICQEGSQIYLRMLMQNHHGWIQ